MLPDEFSRRIAKYPLQAGVHIKQNALVVDADAVEGCLAQNPVTRFTLLQGHFRPFLISHVSSDSGDADGCAMRILE